MISFGPALWFELKARCPHGSRGFLFGFCRQPFKPWFGVTDRLSGGVSRESREHETPCTLQTVRGTREKSLAWCGLTARALVFWMYTLVQIRIFMRFYLKAFCVCLLISDSSLVCTTVGCFVNCIVMTRPVSQSSYRPEKRCGFAFTDVSKFSD